MSEATISPPVVAPPPPAATQSWPRPLLVAGAALFLAHLPLLVAHGHKLWSKPHYQFFPLTLVGAAILAWPAWQSARATGASPKARAVAWVLLGLNWALLAAGVLFESPWLAAVAVWVLLAALAVGVGGWALFRATLPALLYLLLIIPPPFDLDTRLINGLQTMTSRMSSQVLDYFGLYHLMNGNVVEVAGKKYMVEEACSGIHSLLSILACTLFYVFWAHCHWLRGLLLLATSVFWVLVSNVARVVMIVYVDNTWGVDLSKGWQHETLGFVLFALTLAILVSTDRLLLFLGKTVTWNDPLDPKNVAKAAAAHAAASRTRGRLAGLPTGWALAGPVAVAYVLPILLQAGDYQMGALVGQVKTVFTGDALIEAYKNLPEDTLPEKIDRWQRVGNSELESRPVGNAFGLYSRAWRYQMGNLNATVSFDFPYDEWHDLAYCYRGIGWTIPEITAFHHDLPDESGTSLTCWRMAMGRPTGKSSLVWFAGFDQSGAPVSKEDVVIQSRWEARLQRFTSGWKGLFGRDENRSRLALRVLQVQTLVESYAPISEAEQQATEKLFTTAAERVRRACVAAFRAPGAR